MVTRSLFFSKICGAVAAATGLVVLVGWWLHLPALTSIHPSVVAMKANTALALLLAGAALVLLADTPISLRYTRTGRVLALFVAVIGALTLGEYFFGWQLGIDELLFKDAADAVATLIPGRMAPTTAINFLLLGLALVGIEWEPRRGFRPAEWLALVGGVVSLTALVEYAAGTPLLYAFDAYTRMAPHTATVLSVLFTGVLLARPALGVIGVVRSGRASRLELGIYTTIAVTLLAVLVGGASFYRAQEQRMREEVEAGIGVIARLKVEQIVQWRTDRLGDGTVLAASSIFADAVRRWLADPRAELTEGILSRFNATRRYNQYSDVQLVDARARVRLSLSGSKVLDPEEVHLLAAVRQTKQPALSDLHTGSGTRPPHLDLIAPLLAGAGAKRQFIGAVVLRLDARQFLYPLIQSWPTASPSAENLLVRRDGNDVLFLNDLRHRPTAAFRLRIPLGRREVPAVAAGLGNEGVFRGTDYRGVQSLSVLSKIPNTSWFMVSKVDEAEAMADWRFRARLIVTVILSMMLALAAGTGAFWQQRQRFRALRHASETLEHERRKLDAAFQGTDVGLVICDAQGGNIAMNSAALKLHDFTSVDEMSSRIEHYAAEWELRYPDGRIMPFDEWPLPRAMRGDFVRSYDTHLANTRTGYRWACSYSSAPVRDGHGQVVLIVMTLLDITARLKAEVRLHGDQQVMSMVAMGKPLADTLDALARHAETQLNGALCSILLLDVDGLHLRHAAAPSLPEAYNRAIDGIAIGPTAGSCGTAAYLRQRVIVADIATDPLWADCSDLALSCGLRACWSSPVQRADGSVLGTFAVYQPQPQRPTPEDLATIDRLSALANVAIERALSEEALLRANADLEAKVVERTVQLREANAELTKGSRLKDEFLANMSHELRTPLNSILGLSETLIEQLTDTVSPRQVNALATIATSGQHLLALINDILDLSKIEAGMLELNADTVHMQEFCENCLAFVRTQAMTKHIDIATTLDSRTPHFQADPRRFKQVLVNLLTNAVKFTPEGGRIGLTVSAPDDEAVVRFTVWDTGIGIAPADMAKLFKAFTQLDSGLDRQEQGTGLGLALVAKLVELHGGSVTLESAPGQGSRFTVTLPRVIVPSPAPESPAPKSTATDQADRRIYRRALIIEDDATAVAILANYLTELGIASVMHECGELAVEAAVREQPDVILLDILLPGESGWTVLARLKDHPQTRDLPVIVISVVDEPEKSRALGAVAHFTKPITRAQLAYALQRETVKVTPWKLPDSVTRPAAGGAAILLAEDNEANIQTVGGYLEYKGHAMHYARNGLVAVQLARELRPTLILMDIQMPVMDGLTAIREVRADAALRDVPIVALTALAMPGDRERCLAAGATEYVCKPVNLKALAEIVARLVPS